jgi:hypothetical protein
MRYRLFDMPWNSEEQYEMLAFPFVDWSWLIQYRINFDRLRPEFENMVQWVTYYEEGRYDAAILHLDLDFIEPLRKALSRRLVYKELNALIRHIPKIVIVHGSWVETEARAREVRELIGDNYAVVSSNTVAEQLGVGHVVAAGVIPDDWCDLPKEPRVVTSCKRVTSLGASAIESLREALETRDIDLCVIGVDFVPKTWKEYRDFLGSSLVYFAPPACSERAKLEAMLSGCCVLMLGPHARADACIEVNKFEYLVPGEPEKIASLVEDLIIDPDRAIAMGRAAKTAAALGHDWKRYSQEWLNCFDVAINGMCGALGTQLI